MFRSCKYKFPVSLMYILMASSSINIEKRRNIEKGKKCNIVKNIYRANHIMKARISG